MPSACAATLGRDLLSDASRIFRPVARLAEQVRARHAAAVEGERRGAGGAQAHLVLLAQHLSPGVPFSSTSTEIALRPSSISLHLPNSR